AGNTKDTGDTTSVYAWRRTAGAFQLAIPVSTRHALLDEERRSLSILRWIEQTIPVETRWYPVFRRYIDQMARRLVGLGGDPTVVLPSGSGDWKHGPCPPKDRKPDHHGDRDHDRDLDEVTGKVRDLHYDHFGDFTGFEVETYHGRLRRIDSREDRIEHL